MWAADWHLLGVAVVLLHQLFGRFFVWLQELFTVGSEIVVEVGLTDADAPADTDGAQYASLNVPAHRDRMHPQTLGDFINGQELVVVLHMHRIACVCMR